MVRGTEGALLHEPTAGVQAGDAVDPRDGDRLLAAQRRQHGHEPPREHRLAGARRTGQQEVVRARGRDRERADRARMAADVGEVRRLGSLGPVARRGRRRLGRAPAAQDRRDLGQTGDARHRQPVDERRLTSALARDDEAGEARPARTLGDGQDPAAVAQLPAERELAEDRPALKLGGGQLLGGGQDAAGRREVEAGTHLAQMRGREVDRDPPLREREVRVQQRGVDALTRFAHGRIRAPDDRKRGQATAQVNLDGHPP